MNQRSHKSRLRSKKFPPFIPNCMASNRGEGIPAKAVVYNTLGSGYAPLFYSITLVLQPFDGEIYLRERGRTFDDLSSLREIPKLIIILNFDIPSDLKVGQDDRDDSIPSSKEQDIQGGNV